MKSTVLIVDENVNALIIAETLLHGRGLPVRSTVDGREACDIVRTGGVALVALDLALTGMNGFEVIRCLRGRFGGPHASMQPRILALSERTDADVERFALQLGADAFLTKPMNPRQFISTVERLLATAARRPIPPTTVPFGHPWFRTDRQPLVAAAR